MPIPSALRKLVEKCTGTGPSTTLTPPPPPFPEDPTEEPPQYLPEFLPHYESEPLSNGAITPVPARVDPKLATIVAKFNALPRPNAFQFQSSKLVVENIWYLSIRPVSQYPRGEILFLCFPGDRLAHTENAFPYKHQLREKARFAIPGLLETFIDFFSDYDRYSGVVKPCAPWAWKTGDAQFARVLEEELRAIGVREELCTVGVCSLEENQGINKTWSKFASRYTEWLAPVAGFGPHDWQQMHPIVIWRGRVTTTMVSKWEKFLFGYT